MVRLLMGATPSPLMPTIMPSSHLPLPLMRGRKESAGKELARVMPAFLCGYLA